MQETNDRSPARSTRRSIVVAAVVAIVAMVTVGGVLAARRGGGEPADIAAPAAPAAPAAAPGSASSGETAPSTSVAQPASSNPPATPAPLPEQEPEPEPVMADGRHPVFLTDVDVDGGTVEFDLLQYLTEAEQAAYRAAHPTGEGGCGCDEGGPIRNDNPRLRRLPVAPNLRVLVQGSSSGTCDGPRTLGVADLPGHFLNGDRDYEPDGGHLGFNAFWLTVDHDTVVGLEEMSCAG
jgi:hypothetical protein